MSTKTICDRCGKECKSIWIVKKGHVVDIEEGGSYFAKRIELCLGCYQDFNYFLKGAKVVKE